MRCLASGTPLPRLTVGGFEWQTNSGIRAECSTIGSRNRSRSGRIHRNGSGSGYCAAIFGYTDSVCACRRYINILCGFAIGAPHIRFAHRSGQSGAAALADSEQSADFARRTVEHGNCVLQGVGATAFLHRNGEGAVGGQFGFYRGGGTRSVVVPRKGIAIRNEKREIGLFANGGWSRNGWGYFALYNDSYRLLAGATVGVGNCYGVIGGGGWSNIQRGTGGAGWVVPSVGVWRAAARGRCRNRSGTALADGGAARKRDGRLGIDFDGLRNSRSAAIFGYSNRIGRIGSWRYGNRFCVLVGAPKVGGIFGRNTQSGAAASTDSQIAIDGRRERRLNRDGFLRHHRATIGIARFAIDDIVANRSRCVVERCACRERSAAFVEPAFWCASRHRERYWTACASLARAVDRGNTGWVHSDGAVSFFALATCGSIGKFSPVGGAGGWRNYQRIALPIYRTPSVSACVARVVGGYDGYSLSFADGAFARRKRNYWFGNYIYLDLLRSNQCVASVFDGNGVFRFWCTFGIDHMRLPFCAIVPIEFRASSGRSGQCYSLAVAHGGWVGGNCVDVNIHRHGFACAAIRSFGHNAIFCIGSYIRKAQCLIGANRYTRSIEPLVRGSASRASGSD